MKKNLILLIALFLGVSVFSQSGIKGVITDGDFDGEPLFGANIWIEQVKNGTSSGFEGEFKYDLSPGNYTVVISFISYTTVTKNITVVAGQYTEINEELKSGMELGPVTIEYKKVTNDVAATTKAQKDAETTVSNTSAEEMSNRGANTAQAAVRAVTGVAVNRGGEVNVRGMDSRYIAVSVNGMVIPGTDPDRNSVQLDLIPTTMLDNISVSKTFSPDLPGNSTGGSIDLKIKDYDNKKFFKVKGGAGFNDLVSFNSNNLTYEGGSLDWLGYDDGSRKIPEELKNDPFFLYNGTDTVSLLSSGAAIRARRDSNGAAMLDAAAKSVNNQMQGNFSPASFNRKVSFSLGDTIHIGKPAGMHDRVFGYIFGAGYRLNYGMRDGIEAERTDWTYLGDSVEHEAQFIFKDYYGEVRPNINALWSMSYEPWDQHKFSFNTMYNHSAQKSARMLTGTFPGVISAPTDYVANVLDWVERDMINTQILGKHKILKNDSTAIRNVELNWAGNYFYFYQDQPDIRFFSYDTLPASETDAAEYYISRSEYTIPAHFWRTLEDVQTQAKFDIKIPLFHDKDKALFKNYVKIGGLFSVKKRSFGENTFSVENRNIISAFGAAQGNPTVFFADENMGVVDENNGTYTINNYIFEDTDPRNSYVGTTKINAQYAMASINPFKKVKVIGGARLEQSFFNVTNASGDTSMANDTTKYFDVLPALNVVVDLDSAGDMKWRSSVSRTVARPTMRELADFTAFAFIGGPFILGNPDLRRSLITNYDTRFEYYPSRNGGGESITVGAYYKSFIDPISRAFKNASGAEITWSNVADATLYGGEFEYRRKLDSVATFLKGFSFNVNYSYIISSANVDTLSDALRPFPGQSNHLANFGLGYKNDSSKLSLNLTGGYFSDRLSIIQRTPLMDVYEKGRFNMTFTAKKELSDRLKFSFKVANLINAPITLFHKSNGYEGREDGYVRASFRTGRVYSFTLTYDLFHQMDEKE